MSSYRYKARSEAGKSVTGTLEAPTREAVVAHLEEMGLHPDLGQRGELRTKKRWE